MSRDEAAAIARAVAMASPHQHRSRRIRWWWGIPLGVLALVFTVDLYSELTRFEEEGGEVLLNRILAFVYLTLGKWPSILLMGFSGSLLIYMGVQDFRLRRRNRAR